LPSEGRERQVLETGKKKKAPHAGLQKPSRLLAERTTMETEGRVSYGTIYLGADKAVGKRDLDQDSQGKKCKGKKEKPKSKTDERELLTGGSPSKKKPLERTGEGGGPQRQNRRKNGKGRATQTSRKRPRQGGKKALS